MIVENHSKHLLFESWKKEFSRRTQREPTTEECRQAWLAIERRDARVNKKPRRSK